MLSHLSHSKASNRYRWEAVHSLPDCLSLSCSMCVCVCSRFLTIAWSHIPRPQGVWSGRLPEISISRKSALLSRHNSMGFICVCYFFSFLFVAAVIFHFDFALPPTSPPPHAFLLLLQLFFIVTDPEASRAVAGHLRPAYACVGSFGPQISTSFWIIMENIKWMSRPFIFITKLCSLHQIYYERFALCSKLAF